MLYFISLFSFFFKIKCWTEIVHTSGRRGVVNDCIELILSFWLEVERRSDTDLTGSSHREVVDVIVGVSGGGN